MATEKVQPLNWDLRTGRITPETIKWGLWSIAVSLFQASGGMPVLGFKGYAAARECMLIAFALREQNTVRFVNDDAACIHGNIRAGSVFTSESGEWKLGGFEVMSSVRDDEPFIYVSGVIQRFMESILMARTEIWWSATRGWAICGT